MKFFPVLYFDPSIPHWHFIFLMYQRGVCLCVCVGTRACVLCFLEILAVLDKGVVRKNLLYHNRHEVFLLVLCTSEDRWSEEWNDKLVSDPPVTIFWNFARGGPFLCCISLLLTLYVLISTYSFGCDPYFWIRSLFHCELGQAYYWEIPIYHQFFLFIFHHFNLAIHFSEPGGSASSPRWLCNWIFYYFLYDLVLPACHIWRSVNLPSITSFCLRLHLDSG